MGASSDTHFDSRVPMGLPLKSGDVSGPRKRLDRSVAVGITVRSETIELIISLLGDMNDYGIVSMCRLRCSRKYQRGKKER